MDQREYRSSSEYEYANIPEYIPPLGYGTTSESEVESDTGSLYGYYDRLVENNPDQLMFACSDGKTVSFGRSSTSLLSHQGSLTSNDTIFKINEKNFIYENMPIKHLRWEVITLIVLLIGYAGKYFNSAHFYIIANTWQSDVMTMSELKILCGVGISLCFISKIILGSLCDRYEISKIVFIFASIAVSISSLMFALGRSSGWLIFCASLLSVSIPGTWVSLIGILARWIPISRQGRIFSIFASCFFLGDMVSFISVEAVVYTEFSWRIYVIIVSIICFLCAIPAMFLLRSTPKRAGLREPPSTKSTMRSFKPKSFKELFKPLVQDKTLWAISFLALEIYGICQYFLIYTWQYVLICYCGSDIDDDAHIECMGSQNAKFIAIGVSLLFPFCGVFSSIFCGILKDGISRKHRSVLMTTFTSAFLIFLISMHFILPYSSLPAAIIFVCFCGFSILGPYSLLCGAFAVDVGGKYRSSTVTGILDAFGFISETMVVVICYFYGSTSLQSFIVLVVLSLAAVVTSLVLWYIDYHKKPRQVNPLLDKFYEETNADHFFIIDTSANKTGSLQNCSE